MQLTSSARNSVVWDLGCVTLSYGYGSYEGGFLHCRPPITCHCTQCIYVTLFYWLFSSALNLYIRIFYLLPTASPRGPVKLVLCNCEQSVIHPNAWSVNRSIVLTRRSLHVSTCVYHSAVENTCRQAESCMSRWWIWTLYWSEVKANMIICYAQCNTFSNFRWQYLVCLLSEAREYLMHAPTHQHQ